MQDKMNELQEQLNKANKEIEELKAINEGLVIKNKDHMKEIEEHNTMIKELKLKNYDLLTQVGTKVEEKPIVEEPAMSLNEITNILKGE